MFLFCFVFDVAVCSFLCFCFVLFLMWQCAPSALSCAFLFLKNCPACKDPNGIKLFVEAFWAILGTLNTYFMCLNSQYLCNSFHVNLFNFDVFN